MDQDASELVGGPEPQLKNRVVHQIGGGDIVIETFDDGSVRVNGDIVTPAKQVVLDAESDTLN